MKTQNHRIKSGFTLVELLVVVAIIATLVAVSFSVGPKMMKKSKQATSVQNMRQICGLVAGYAAENGNRLPSVQVVRTAEDPPEWPAYQYWHHVVMRETDPYLTINQLMSDAWWKREKAVLLNPLQPKDKITHYTTGYAFNLNIAHNLNPATNSYPFSEQTKRYQTPLAAIPDPARTPLVSANSNWAFTGSLDNPKMEPYLVDEKFDLAFVDGHVELITPKQYLAKKLDKQPIK